MALACARASPSSAVIWVIRDSVSPSALATSP